MEKIELQANTRVIQGKKVRFLRREGIIPVNLFGHGIASLALQCDTGQLERTAARAGRTQLINLKVDNDGKPRVVMVKEVQKEVMTGNLLHVDFYQVTMTEKVNVELPVILVGEAPAEKSKNNTIAHELDSLSIEALPGDIPTSIEVDISSLSELDQVIRVSDLNTGQDVTILTDPEQVVVRVVARPMARGEGATAEEEGATSGGAAPAEEKSEE